MSAPSSARQLVDSSLMSWEWLWAFSTLTVFMPIRASVAGDPAYLAWVANARPLLQPFVDAMHRDAERVPELPGAEDRPIVIEPDSFLRRADAVPLEEAQVERVDGGVDVEDPEDQDRRKQQEQCRR